MVFRPEETRAAAAEERRRVLTNIIRKERHTMAAVKTPAPGTEYGPCLDETCAHRDCQASRDMAETDCGICVEAIGYEVWMYNDEAYGLVHAACLEHEVEATRKARAAR